MAVPFITIAKKATDFQKCALQKFGPGTIKFSYS